MKTKRIIATLLSMIMLISMFPVVSQATLVDSTKGKAIIHMVLLTDDATNSNFPFKSMTKEQLATAKANKGEFYVGLYTENFNNIYEVANYVKRSNSDKDYGMNGISIPIAFNGTYLFAEPENYDNSEGGEFSIDNYAGLNDTFDSRMNFTGITDATTPANNRQSIRKKSDWTNAQYKYSDGTGFVNPAKVDTDRGFDQLLTVDVTNSGASQNRVPGYSGGDDNVYLAIVKFQFKENADKLDPGTILIGHGETTQQTNMSFGNGTKKVTYQDYGVAATATGTTQYVYNVLDFDTSEIDDMYPLAYSIDFYTDNTYGTKITAAGKTFTASSIEGGTKVNEITGLNIPEAGTDFSSPNADGKYFAGFKYIDSNGDEQDFSETMTINAAAADKNVSGDTKTQVRVYATWSDPWSATFHTNYYSDQTDHTGDSDDPKDTTYTQSGIAPSSSATEPTGDAWNVNGTKVRTGWLNSSGTEVTDLTSANAPFYAKWEDGIPVTFKKTETATDNLKTKVLSKAASATDRTITKTDFPSEPTETGKIFDGWAYKVSGGSETKITDLDSFSYEVPTTATKVEFYATWKDAVTVKFYASKTDTDPESTITVEKNTAFDDLTSEDKAKAADKSDDTDNKKYFMGWYLKSDDTTKVTFDNSYTFSADQEVFAKYGDFYQIKYYNKQKGESDNTQFVDTVYVNPNDDSFTGKVLSSYIPSGTPTAPAGKGFSKWVYYPSDTKTDFEAGVEISGNIDVYPDDWASELTIKLYPNDGTGDDKLGTAVEKKVLPGNKISGYTAPTRTGYTLTSWNTASNGSGTSISEADLQAKEFQSTDDLVYYAQWTPASDPAVLNFDKNNSEAATPDPASVTVKLNDYVTSNLIPTNVVDTTNYKFKGWYDGKAVSANAVDFTGAGYQLKSTPQTVYAHWDYTGSDAVEINFYDGSDKKYTVKVAPSTTDGLGDLMPADLDDKTGYSFDSWNTASDGSGTTFDQDTPVGTATSRDVYAKWAKDITISYNVNGGTGTVPDQSGKKDADYADPTVTPTKSGYKLLGWYTKINGGGTKVEAKTDFTIGDVADLFKVGDTTPTEVTLYAKWGFTDGDGGETDPPKANGVRVVFEGNGTTAHPVTTEADPKVRHVQLGGTIGSLTSDSDTSKAMPTVPVRTGYKFVSWNTQPDGTGTTFNESTIINASLDGIKEITDGSTQYEAKVYAQWDVADDTPEEDKVTITLNKNSDGTGKAGDDYKTYTILKNDSLGFIPTQPTGVTEKADFDFKGWKKTAAYNPSDTTAYLVANDTFDNDTTIYAQWLMGLYIKVNDKTTGTGESAVIANKSKYDGTSKTPTYNVYIAKEDSEAADGYTLVKPLYATGGEADAVDFTTSPYNTLYTAKYKLSGSDAADIKDAGQYVLSGVDLAADYAKTGVYLIKSEGTYEVLASPLDVKVDPEKQEQKAGKADTTGLIASVKDGAGDDKSSEVDIKFYKWNDANNNKTIDSGEVSNTEVTIDSTTTVGKYVVKVIPKTNNYTISSVTKVDGAASDVILYDGTKTGYPSYIEDGKTADTMVGRNIVLEIVPSDPSASSIVGYPVDKDDTVGTTAIQWKESDYATNRSFDNKYDESDSTKPAYTDYYARVGKDTKKVQFVVTPTNKETTVLKAPTAGTGVTVAGPDGTTGAWTITVDLTNTGATANDITITTAAGNAATDPQISYNFHIQVLVEAKIELNYGNSPYGAIMAMTKLEDTSKRWDSEKAADAKKKFLDNDNTFNYENAADKQYVPDNVNAYVQYSMNAWNNEVSAEKNMDRNDYALFVYDRYDFRDPGFTATNSLGETVPLSDVTRTITVQRMAESSLAAITTKNYSPSTITLKGKASDYLFTEVTDVNADPVVPNIYEMKYSFEDSATNQHIEVVRPIVVLWKLGDADLSNQTNAQDIPTIYSIIKNKINIVPASAGTTDAEKKEYEFLTITDRLYNFRISDADMSNQVNAQDLPTIYSIIKGKMTDRVYVVKQ